jgi:site-specific DNA-methyltransferase (adenine-specific)
MPIKPLSQNTLFYGDNLPILREYVADESVDLIYLDPPFNSNRSYNVLFRDEKGREADAQVEAFEDTWHWGEEAEEIWNELVTSGAPNVSAIMGALRQVIHENQMMAYLVMMTARLVELHRVLKPTGSLYLHCDSTASHYLKMVLDAIVGIENFQNEVVWKRFNFHADAKRFGKVTDRILFYSKTADFVFHRLRVPFSEDYTESKFTHVDSDGRRYRLDNLNPPGGRGPVYEFHGVTKAWRFTKDNMLKLESEGRIYSGSTIPQLKRYLDELEGQAVHELWTDIPPINPQAGERLGYPTQKPMALLERIIEASSTEGGLVLDPFCGCGTTIAAAEKLKRRWIGIDITNLAIALMKSRLKEMFKLEPGPDYKVIGEPTDLAGAKQLAAESRYQFQWWALSLIEARPFGASSGERSGKKGSDRGMDGLINFIDDASKMPKRVLVQVKSGGVKSGDIRDLVGTLESEKAAMGVFITLEEPTREMKTAAVKAGIYESPGFGRKYPRIQILTVGELLHGAKVEMPPAWGTFKRAERVQKQHGSQPELGLE